MMSLIRLSGTAGPILVVIALVILLIVARRGFQLVTGSFLAGPEWDASVNGILFWGCFAAVLGVLGQTTAIYLALSEIRHASELSPRVVVEGFMISFSPTLLGLAILTGAALFWYVLKVWARRVTRVAPRS